MPTEKFTQLPTVANATPADIICAVQAGTSVQETLAQVSALFLSQTILSFAGNPNGHVAGTTFQLCWDTTDEILYVCTTSGTALTAVWTSTGINGIVDPTHGGTGVSNPPAGSIPIAEGSSDFHFLSLLNGQLLIGASGSDPVPAFLTAGANIALSFSAGGIQISSSGGTSIVWSTITVNTQAMSIDNGYVANCAALLTFTLPATSAVGDVLQVVGKGVGGWKIAQNAGQSIVIGIDTSTVGVAGFISSTDASDSIYLVCTVANTEWRAAVGPQGNITVS